MLKRIFLLASIGFAALPYCARAEDTLSVRGWYFYDEISGGQFTSANGAQDFTLSSPPFKIPMGGLAYTHRGVFGVPDASFTLSGMYGTASATLQTRGANVVTFPNGTQQVIVSLQHASQDLKRTDIEAVYQRPINDLISWAVGARYERARITFVSTVQNISSNPVTGAIVQPPPTTTAPFTGGYDLTSVRGGLTMSVPIGEGGQHSLYGSAFGFVGYRSDDNPAASPLFKNATLAGPDISIGYVFRATDHVTIDARYRGIFFYEVSGGTGSNVPKVTHGLNVGLNVSF
ncbi:MAG: hypothetical protein ACJ798_04805 [Phenylobacterium sp.]